MLEGLIGRLARIGEERSRTRSRELAERLRAALPGIEVKVADEGVSLSARGLRRRIARESRLGWLIAGLLK